MKKPFGILLTIIISFHNSLGILTGLKCRTSDKGTCIDPFCQVTPVNEKLNAASFGCGKFTRPLNTIKVRQEFYFKFYQDYIPFNIFPEIEYCSFVKNPNVFSYFYGIYTVMKEKLPGFVKQCPYYGTDFQIRNLTLFTSDLALWITGEYKLVYTLYDDVDPRIYQISARGVINRN